MHSDRLSRRTLLIGAGATAGAAHVASRAMSTAEPPDWTLNQAAAALRKRKISSIELTQLCLKRIHALDNKLNANFAAHLKSFSSEVGGNKESGYTLTARGLAAATDIVKVLVEL